MVAPPPAIEEAATGATAVAPARRSRPGLTARAVALLVVLLILVISYASSLRIYLAQATEISAKQAEIAQREDRIAELEGQLARWGDPAYVRTQARERLGWVVPGETGFRVVGPDGKPLGGGAEIESAARPLEEAPKDAWWARLWGSVEAADDPAPATPEPEEPEVITPDTDVTDPEPSPTPR